MLVRMRRLETVDEFRHFGADEWPEIAGKACRIALTASGLEDETADDCLRLVERGQYDQERAAWMRALADRLDGDAWAAQDAGDDARYLRLFGQARTASALAFALLQEPDEAIYEAAHAFESLLIWSVTWAFVSRRLLPPLTRAERESRFGSRERPLALAERSDGPQRTSFEPPRASERPSWPGLRPPLSHRP